MDNDNLHIHTSMKAACFLSDLLLQVFWYDVLLFSLYSLSSLRSIHIRCNDGLLSYEIVTKTLMSGCTKSNPKHWVI